MNAIEPHLEGAVIQVRAHAGGRINGLRGLKDNAVKVSVTQVAEKGKANQAILAVLAQSLGLRRSQLELISGATSTHKRFLVRGFTVEQLGDKVAAALADAQR